MALAPNDHGTGKPGSSNWIFFRRSRDEALPIRLPAFSLPSGSMRDRSARAKAKQSWTDTKHHHSLQNSSEFLCVVKLLCLSQALPTGCCRYYWNIDAISKFTFFSDLLYLLGLRYSLFCRVVVSSSSQNYQKCNCSAKRHEMRVGVTWVIPFFAYQWGYQHLLKCPKVVDLPLVIGTSNV